MGSGLFAIGGSGDRRALEQSPQPIPWPPSKTLLDELVPKRDLEIRVLDLLTGQTEGCGGGGKLAVTTGALSQPDDALPR
jgi:hypothetical protein